MLQDEGARNGELVGLSTEPENWTHFRGGPVSRDGVLVGVVHGVWPDRMVFLSAHALLEQSGFQAVMAEHLLPGPGEAGYPESWVCLAVGARARRSEGGTEGRYDAGAEVAGLLEELLRDSGATGRLIAGPDDVLLLAVDGPGALVKAGRILSALPARGEAFLGARTPWITGLDVVASTGEAAFEDGQAAVAAARQFWQAEDDERVPGAPGRLHFLLSDFLYGELDGLLGPALPPGLRPGDLARLGGDPETWFYTGDPVDLGYAMAEAGKARSEGPGWPHCGVLAVEGDRRGCIGIRVPGYDLCLAHLQHRERDAYLGTLGPRSPVDFRGTTFDSGLLQLLFQAVQEPESRRVDLGPAAFDRAHFVNDWTSTGTVFWGRASFDRAVFSGRPCSPAPRSGGGLLRRRRVPERRDLHSLQLPARGRVQADRVQRHHRIRGRRLR